MLARPLLLLLFVLPLAGSLQASAERTRTEAGPPVEVHEGYVVNFVRRYYFPLGKWTLTKADADFQELHHSSLPNVILRVLVSDKTASLEQTMLAVREQSVEDPRVHVLSEGRRRVGMNQAGELLALRGSKPGEQTALLRTVCFIRNDHKYYVRLESTPETYEKLSPQFENLLSEFKFESRFKFPWQKK